MFKSNFRLYNIYCIKGEGEYLKIPRNQTFNNCIISKKKSSESLCFYYTKLSDDNL